MSKYALIYKAKQAFDWTTLPEEETQKVMAAWNAWIDSLGSALSGVEVFKYGGRSVSKAGAKEADNLLTGFALIEVADFAQAEKWAASAPNVVTDKGTVEVYEILPLAN